MAMKDISWGSVILGAAAVTAFVAMAPAAIPLLTVLGTTAAAKGAVLAGAAIAGGVAGNMVSKIFGRAQDATTTLVER